MGRREKGERRGGKRKIVGKGVRGRWEEGRIGKEGRKEEDCGKIG